MASPWLTLTFLLALRLLKMTSTSKTARRRSTKSRRTAHSFTRETARRVSVGSPKLDSSPALSLLGVLVLSFLLAIHVSSLLNSSPKKMLPCAPHLPSRENSFPSATQGCVHFPPQCNVLILQDMAFILPKMRPTNLLVAIGILAALASARPAGASAVIAYLPTSALPIYSSFVDGTISASHLHHVHVFSEKRPI